MARTMVNRPEQTGCEFSPSVACGDSSLVRGSQGDGGFSFAGAKPSGGRGLLLRRSQAQRGTGASPSQEPSPAGTGMLRILLKNQFFYNFAPDRACPGHFFS